MSVIDKIIEKAKSDKKFIVLPEGTEERTVQAAEKITKQGIAKVALIGKEDEIKAVAAKFNVDLTGVELIDQFKSPDMPAFVERFYEMRKAKGVDMEKAAKTMQDPLFFAAMMVKTGKADGMVAGAINTTGNTLRPALQIIKTAPGISTVSSCFIMECPNKSLGADGVLLFADCAVNPDPTDEQLAAIAVASANTAKALCGFDPKVAMLSFSTKGSAKHENVEKVQRAVAMAHEIAPDLELDGELQLDAAVVQKVADLKAPGSKVAGHANVLVFPDLQAGNIGYKLVQRFAGAEAVGPVSQGFAAPVNDLSRGCSVQDVVAVVAITAVQAQGLKL